LASNPLEAPAPSALGSLRRLLWPLAAVALLALYIHAFRDTHVSGKDLFTGIRNIGDIIRRSMPPKLNVLGDSLRASVVTFDTALLGTTAAVIIAVVLAPLGARNTTPSRLVCELVRLVFAVTRSMEALIFALIFVTAVGLGPYSGVLALAVHSVGIAGKLFAETIEDLDPGPVDALRIAGASRPQIFLHAVLPGVAPTFVGLTLYRFDVNFRCSLVLGFVGAGGVGFLIFNSMELFQYREVATELIVVLVFVLAVERVSSLLRSRIV
jgi:phosphonate transport system permease protein